MKKVYICLLILLSLLLAITLVSCGEETDEGDTGPKEPCADGEHQFLTWKIEKEGFCCEAGQGIKSRTCVICGLYTERQPFIDSTKHKFVNDICSLCGAINGPSDIEFIYYPSGDYYILNSVGDTALKEYTIPEKFNGKYIREIASGAFKKCVNLETVVVCKEIK